MPLATYLLYNYISSLPRDILESAFIDGASHFTIFTQLILPLSVPALASFAIFQFLWVWNDYLVALIFIGAKPDVQVLTMRLAEHGRLARQRLAPADRRRVRLDDPAADRLLLAAALLCARPAGRVGQRLVTLQVPRLERPRDDSRRPLVYLRALRGSLCTWDLPGVWRYLDIRNPLWYKDAVFYEVFVRAFADSNGDGIGDLPGLTVQAGLSPGLGRRCTVDAADLPVAAARSMATT